MKSACEGGTSERFNRVAGSLSGVGREAGRDLGCGPLEKRYSLEAARAGSARRATP